MKRVPEPTSTHRPKVETLWKVVAKTSFGSNEQVWDKLVELGFFEKHPCCVHCGRALKVDDYKKKLHLSVRCSNAKCKKYTNLVGDSQLSGVNNIRLFLYAAISWATGGLVKTMLAATGMSHHTWATYRQKFQNVVNLALDKMNERGELKLGGPGKVVEADECKLFSPKYHKGHPRQPRTSGSSDSSSATATRLANAGVRSS